MREIVLDTETTGTDAKGGDRLVEIGCVELVNHVQTGRNFHRYVNPQRSVSHGAFAVHGLSDSFLADKPLFSDIAEDFTKFCSDSRMVIHNAAFDVGFLNAELSRLGASAPPQIVLSDVVDTLVMARRKHPNSANSLDALCVRYGVDTARRVKHGALLDAQILAEVYIELLGGKQANLGLSTIAHEHVVLGDIEGDATLPIQKRQIQMRLSDAERDSHAALTATLGSSPIWRDYDDLSA